MLQIPKNVLQIGKIHPQHKIYMEDYVHTFLERRGDGADCLLFGKKEERGGIFYYMVYGAEKKADWDRGSMPYFKNYDRIGRLTDRQGQRMFQPVGKAEMPLEGYFVFYERNEDMQAYMITVRETEEAQKERAREEESLMEAVRQRQQAARETRGRDDSVQKVQDSRTQRPGWERRTYQKRIALPKRPSQGRKSVNLRRRRSGMSAGYRQWTIPGFCRTASIVMLLLLVVFGLTSLNRYPDMRAVSQLFGDAILKVTGDQTAQGSLAVEEATLPLEDQTAQDSVAAEETDNASENGSVPENGGIPETESAPQNDSMPETVGNTENTQEAVQTMSRPQSYVVKKGDSLAGICRNFYGSTEKLKEICTLNGIDDPDHIRPGQNIMLP